MQEYGGLCDKRACATVLGTLMLNPLLLEDSTKPLEKADFDIEQFYVIIFVSIYNLFQQNIGVIDEASIDSYLSSRPEQYKIFQENNGIKWVSDTLQLAQIENYEYYYHRVKKFSLLRYYEREGLDTSFLFNWKKFDSAEEQKKFDDITEQEIVDSIEAKFVIEPNMRFCSDSTIDVEMAGDGLRDLVYGFMKAPDVGLPLSSPILTTLTRGCRMGCLYMRGSIQGGGKTRMAAADCCEISIPHYWDVKEKKWVHRNYCEPSVYIVAEQENDEIKTVFLSCVSGVNEEHIKFGKYEKGELERIEQAMTYIEESPLIQVHIPDFSIEDIKNILKKYNREKGVRHFFFDYIFSSMKVMMNMGSKLGMGLKEHQFLLLFSNELKTICQKLQVFMMTACQLNGEVVNARIKDQNVLAGAKALANKLDCGWNSLPPTAAELKKVESIYTHMLGTPEPNMMTWTYKLRSSRITRVIIWSYYDLGIMRCRDLFVTDYNFKLIDVDMTKIEVAEQVIHENSVSINEVEDENVFEEITDNKAEKSIENPIEEFITEPIEEKSIDKKKFVF